MKVSLLPRHLGIPNFQIDTNSINGTQANADLNQIEKWMDAGVICLNMSHIARNEAKQVNYIPRIRKADTQIFTIDEDLENGTLETPQHYEEVKNALFPSGAQSSSEENDVLIVCEAIKFSAHLITMDGNSKKQPGGILGNRTKLRHRICIFTPKEAVEYIRNKIRDRDNFNQEFVRQYGGDLPPWTFKD